MSETLTPFEDSMVRLWATADPWRCLMGYRFALLDSGMVFSKEIDDVELLMKMKDVTHE